MRKRRADAKSAEETETARMKVRGRSGTTAQIKAIGGWTNAHNSRRSPARPCSGTPEAHGSRPEKLPNAGCLQIRWRKPLRFIAGQQETGQSTRKQLAETYRPPPGGRRGPPALLRRSTQYTVYPSLIRRTVRSANPNRSRRYIPTTHNMKGWTFS